MKNKVLYDSKQVSRHVLVGIISYTMKRDYDKYKQENHLHHNLLFTLYNIYIPYYAVQQQEINTAINQYSINQPINQSINQIAQSSNQSSNQ